MVLATPWLALVLLPVWRGVLPRLPRLLGAAVASATLPYAWMVWLSHQGPPISSYGPMAGWGDFSFYVTRPAAAGSTSAPPLGGATARGSWAGSRATSCGRRPCRARCSPHSASGCWRAGAASPERSRWVPARSRGSPPRALACLPCSGNSVVLILLLGFDFDPFWLAVFRPTADLLRGGRPFGRRSACSGRWTVSRTGWRRGGPPPPPFCTGWEVAGRTGGDLQAAGAPAGWPCWWR